MDANRPEPAPLSPAQLLESWRKRVEMLHQAGRLEASEERLRCVVELEHFIAALTARLVLPTNDAATTKETT